MDSLFSFTIYFSKKKLFKKIYISSNNLIRCWSLPRCYGILIPEASKGGKQRFINNCGGSAFVGLGKDIMFIFIIEYIVA